MPRRVQRRPVVEAIDVRIDSRERIRPKQAEVMKIRAKSVDLRIRGSAKLWRNVPVRGSIDNLSVGDIVPLGWWRSRPEVIA